MSTTNGLESILALVEQRVGKVDRWTTSDQKQRWLGTALKEKFTQAKEVMAA